MPTQEMARVSVPTVESWNKAKENVTRAIQSALTDALKGSDAAKRAILEKELMEWRDRMFALAAPNLRVNGQNFEDYVEQPRYRPFDEALDRTVKALVEQSLVQEQTLAERRRTIPIKVQGLLEDLLERQRVAEMQALSMADLDDTSGANDEFSFVTESEQLEMETLETSKVAKQLNETIPHLIQRAQWAQEVSAELVDASTSNHGTR
ncbi:hypothetical protein FRC19_001798 [Serendipita sp. 401]|nr:hypothetical protein FRC15_005794 [Serendipita sp. 397]KAG8772739.1 hypothetical protein FRC16_005566 [Serendipita sp. 398]KAG8814373.1 hypothetical protein FRC19_001798 [Serendipita sp. 401]